MEEIKNAAEAIGLPTEQVNALEKQLLENRKLLDAQKAVCPECKTGKHGNCNGKAGLTDDDTWIDCDCVNAFHALKKLS